MCTSRELSGRYLPFYPVAKTFEVRDQPRHTYSCSRHAKVFGRGDHLAHRAVPCGNHGRPARSYSLGGIHFSLPFCQGQRRDSSLSPRETHAFLISWPSPVDDSKGDSRVLRLVATTPTLDNAQARFTALPAPLHDGLHDPRMLDNSTPLGHPKECLVT